MSFIDTLKEQQPNHDIQAIHVSLVADYQDVDIDKLDASLATSIRAAKLVKTSELERE